MTPERWQQIEQLFHAALACPPEKRSSYLDESCGGDEALRGEVESLLASDATGLSVVEALPAEVAARMFETGQAANIVGETIGRYRVISSIGAGGMGEVYLAEDTTLRRKVAIKLLPHQYVADSERVRRFEQEALVASALNHPNIITIHEIGQWQDAQFIVIEFIEGETLRQHMQQGRIALDELLEISIQTASALAAAHGAGIVHRDIKPANIMIRKDGIVKVLDFGLAKLTLSPFASDLPEGPEAKTDPGRVMGTINYMSPEQALGKSLDHRTDIFSLGVVLYELSCGKLPFGGNSDAAVYDALLNRAPDPLGNSNPVAPRELDRIIRRALEKDPSARYQTASEMCAELKRLQRDTESGHDVTLTPPERASKFRERARMTVLLATLGVAAIASAVWFLWPRTGATTTGAGPAWARATFAHLTTNPGAEIFPSLSPDGKTIIYASQASGNWDIYMQRVGGSAAINLTKDSPADDTQPAYSPDGDQIAFRSELDGGGIFLMGATGENARRISDSGYFPSWSPDGKEIVFSSATFEEPTTRSDYPSALWVVSLATGEKREIGNGDAVQPNWSPHGERIAFWGISPGGVRDIKTVSVGGGEAVAVTDDAAFDWNPVWSPDGKYLYFASNRGGSMNFWRVAIDETTGRPLGAPEPVTTPSTFSQHLAFSANGKVMAFVEASRTSNIMRSEFDPRTEILGREPTPLTGGARLNRNVAKSPDGEWLAFDAIKDKQEDLFVMKRDGSNLRQLTNDINKDRGPRWSPDGQKLIFYSDRSGKYEAWTINVNGTDLKQFTFDSNPYSLLAFWSPDGKQILQNRASAYPNIFSAEKTQSEQTPVRLPSETDPALWIIAYSWSPDGEKIAGMRMVSNSATSGIVIYSVRSQTYRALTNFGDDPVWLNDSRRLVFAQGNRFFLLDTQTAKTRELMAYAPSDIIQSHDFAPDDRSLYFTLEKKEADIWLATLE